MYDREVLEEVMFGVSSKSSFIAQLRPRGQPRFKKHNLMDIKYVDGSPDFIHAYKKCPRRERPDNLWGSES